jgi:hypothetical protein
VQIDWSTLLTVAIVAAAAALAVVVLVAFALVALSARPERQVHGTTGGDPAASPPANPVIAGICLLAAGSIVGYGLYLIIT